MKLDYSNLLLIIFRQIGCNIPTRYLFSFLMVNQVSAIEGLHVPPMQIKFGGVPSPLDHQALCLVIALTGNFVV